MTLEEPINPKMLLQIYIFKSNETSSLTVTTFIVSGACYGNSSFLRLASCLSRHCVS